MSRYCWCTSFSISPRPMCAAFAQLSRAVTDVWNRKPSDTGRLSEFGDATMFSLQPLSAAIVRMH